MTGRDALLDAFDRLFVAAAGKLQVSVTPDERTEAKQEFAARFETVLDVTSRFETPPIPTDVLTAMEAQITQISPRELASVLAAIPLARQAQDMVRTLAIQQAQQKMLEHLASQAETRYGGN